MGNWHHFFLKCLVEFTRKTIWAWSFLYGRLFVTGSAFKADVGSLRPSVSVHVNFGRLCFSRNWFILSMLSMFWAIMLFSVLIYFTFSVHVIGSDDPYFISNIDNLHLLSFLFWLAWLGV